jgi:peptide/nickel transport system ATP-binding protein
VSVRASPGGALLEVDGLSVAIGDAPVVDAVSFSLAAGKTLALVGESGCGKSLTARALIRLLPPVARQVGGVVRLEGSPLGGLAAAEMAALRGVALSMIFQEPSAALDPLMPVGEQIVEAVLAHRSIGRRAAVAAALAMLEAVGIPDPRRRMRQYPFELSGGMNQRIMIAIALICRPRLLIADEPTTALDVTIQAQILAVLKRLQRETGAAVLLITHDMGVVADMADRVAVMYAGRIVEEGDVFDLFRRQHHPYTRLLLNSLPALTGARERLSTIEGSVPDFHDWPSGCRFHPRCPLADAQCRAAAPPLAAVDGPEHPVAHPAEHLAACWHREAVPEFALP